MKILTASALFAFCLLAWTAYRLKTRRPARAATLALRRQWAKVEKIDDPARAVLEGDKALDAALRALRYRGSVGEKLRRAGPRLPNLDAVWSAHKLRNRIAHEPDVRVTRAQADKALRAFKSIVDFACK